MPGGGPKALDLEELACSSCIAPSEVLEPAADVDAADGLCTDERSTVVIELRKVGAREPRVVV